MAILQISPIESHPTFNEKKEIGTLLIGAVGAENPNPVKECAEYAYKKANLVRVNPEGVSIAARYIRDKLLSESYSPRTWRTHALHILPREPYSPSDSWNKTVLDWIFLISSLNFSFWSEKEGQPDRYGVEWQSSWDDKEKKVWTGYWSLVAALNKAMQSGIPITDPTFYSSETLCPDVLIESVFQEANQSSESIPLLQQRIAIMREVGFILTNAFGGSYQGLLAEFQRRHDGQGTAIDLVKLVTETFPSFKDEVYLDGRKVCIWKRAQILVADTWAAFYPDPSVTSTHPLFPGTRGASIQDLTMFADYRVPQILHHLKILSYPSSLVDALRNGVSLAPGSREEISLRAASIVAVERVREEMIKLMQGSSSDSTNDISSVLIDFFLWDLAKRLERGEDKVEGIDTVEIIPAHRTRSIWY
ncbi:conserved eukaryotic protein [Moniliophthora roreri MCA 2997]|uniref:Queuosine 5'-phosphate N-glycosylase/hydrolase n=1 Tax=Moniliophthora roreri (strain MCA 2997) TaxID=1381753 RepID=V2XTL1_MONRO|nr:conserved eukaryotic protein [Moniliophthora roreri MCA 2997]